MPRGKTLTEEQRNDISKAYSESRMSRSDIAAMFDIAPTTVNRIVRENGRVVTVDAQDLVVEVQPILPPKATNLCVEWEVKFEGSVIVEAESIDQALAMARKLGVAKRIISAQMRGK